MGLTFEDVLSTCFYSVCSLCIWEFSKMYINDVIKYYPSEGCANIKTISSLLSASAADWLITIRDHKDNAMINNVNLEGNRYT